ncbi:MAG: tRNA (N6-isopentenyl adenosine(37)-C2)-methylthiotransferase MiaB [Deltaproteobacteria bacterium]|nr:tRNA (N6-isopentenyl adenosine(37)-C2)-methylthiotransferase MiaB [Deltaproteobacteria bacterium]
MRNKYFYIHTFGCQMNVHDSEQMGELLKKSGYKKTDDMGKSDLIIINTCSVRAKAEQKVYSMLGRLKTLKKKNPNMVICIAGCLAQQLGVKYLKKVPYLDLVIGTHNAHLLPEMVREAETCRVRAAETGFHGSIKSMDILVLPEDVKITAFVTIMQGCDNFCTYCIVPHVRGREKSRESSDVIKEIKALVTHGVKEVTLLGQNVNSYGANLPNGQNFPTLLKEIGEIGGIDRIRFTTSHPKDISDELIGCFFSIGALCEHIHLPVQSGSDDILRRMNRGYTSKDYLEKVDHLREVCPGISITSDIIVGFPGESEEDFQKTIDLMEKVRFDSTFSFGYSDRAGTVAEGYENKVASDIKTKRLSSLQLLQGRHTLENNRAMLGEVTEILVEGFSKNDQDELMGRTRTNKIVNIRGNSNLIGRELKVKITETFMHSLKGELLS